MSMLGSHVSCQGGFAKAVERATAVGCDCLQLFVSNPPRQWPVKERSKAGAGYEPISGCPADGPAWSAKPLDETLISDWKSALGESTLRSSIAHASYLINLASPDEALYGKSIEAMIVELDRANALGLEGLVVHPGAYTSSDESAGLDRVIDAVHEVFARSSAGSARLLLENTAGQGSCLGHTIEQLAVLVSGIDSRERLGVCLDTCHAYAAGYAINDRRQWRDFKRALQDQLPKHCICALHLNDSKKPLGSRVDRHEHIGRGEIGLEGFRLLLNDPLFRRLPGYLETEKGTDEETGEDWDRINLAALRELV